MIEDDMHLGPALRELLAVQGYDVDLAQSAKEAFRALASDDFQIAVLDLELGNESGVELIEKLRREGHRVPALVILSAQPQDIRQRAALRTGALVTLQKPCSVQILNRAIEGVVERTRSWSAAS
jgi:DNA-binding response OmpR family regulator